MPTLASWRTRAALGVTTLGLLVAAPAGAAPVWSAPADLSAAGHDAHAPQVAVDPQGDAVAVWHRSDGANDIVQSSLRPAGAVWQAPVDLSATGANAVDPQVALDAQGDAVAIWDRSDGANQIAQGSVRAAGGAGQAAVDLSAAGADALALDLAVDAPATPSQSGTAQSSCRARRGRPAGPGQGAVTLSALARTRSTPERRSTRRATRSSRGGTSPYAARSRARGLPVPTGSCSRRAAADVLCGRAATASGPRRLRAGRTGKPARALFRVVRRRAALSVGPRRRSVAFERSTARHRLDSVCAIAPRMKYLGGHFSPGCGESRQTPMSAVPPQRRKGLWS